MDIEQVIEEGGEDLVVSVHVTARGQPGGVQCVGSLLVLAQVGDFAFADLHVTVQANVNFPAGQTDRARLSDPRRAG